MAGREGVCLSVCFCSFSGAFLRCVCFCGCVVCSRVCANALIPTKMIGWSQGAGDWFVSSEASSVHPLSHHTPSPSPSLSLLTMRPHALPQHAPRACPPFRRAVAACASACVPAAPRIAHTGPAVAARAAGAPLLAVPGGRRARLVSPGDVPLAVDVDLFPAAGTPPCPCPPPPPRVRLRPHTCLRAGRRRHPHHRLWPARGPARGRLRRRAGGRRARAVPRRSL